MSATAVQISIPVPELGRRIRERMGNSAQVPRVIWQDSSGGRVLLHLDTLKVKALDGWLLAELELETDLTKRQKLQFLFFLGRESEANGTTAGATINATTVQAAQLADRWGSELQRVMWDAVLDGVEFAVGHMKGQQRGPRLVLDGFTCQGNNLNVRAIAGEF